MSTRLRPRSVLAPATSDRRSGSSPSGSWWSWRHRCSWFACSRCRSRAAVGSRPSPRRTGPRTRRSPRPAASSTIGRAFRSWRTSRRTRSRSVRPICRRIGDRRSSTDWRRSSDIDPADINVAIDSNPGSRFDLVRVAADVDATVANFISESRLDLPGVEVVVESRRDYATGPLLSQVIGYTGPVNEQQLLELESEGYLPDDLIGKAGVEAQYEAALRGTYGLETVERDASGRRLQVLQTVTPPGRRELRRADDRRQGAAVGGAGAEVGHVRGRSEAGRRHRHEPADRRDPRPRQPADLRRQPVRPRDQQRRLPGARRRPEQAADEPRDRRPLPAGVDVQARHRDRRPRRRRHLADDRAHDAAVPDPRHHQVLRVEPQGMGSVRPHVRVRALERHVLLPGGRDARDRPARLLGEPVRVRAAVRHRLARRGFRDRALEPVEARDPRDRDLPGRGLSGRDRPGLRRRHAAPAGQCVRGAGERRDAVRTARGPERDRRDGQRRPGVRARASCASLDVDGDVLETMRKAARNVVLIRHTYNLVDLPIVVAGKVRHRGVRERATPRAGFRSTRGSSPSSRRTRPSRRRTRPG